MFSREQYHQSIFIFKNMSFDRFVHCDIAMIRSASSALRPGLLSQQASSLFLCDIQEVFYPLIHHSETVVRRSNFLYKVCKELSIPCLITVGLSICDGE